MVESTGIAVPFLSRAKVVMTVALIDCQHSEYKIVEENEDDIYQRHARR